MKAFTISGASLKVVINGQTFGFVTGFNYSIDYGKKEIRGIDTPFVQEIATGPISVRGTVNCIRLKDRALEQKGLVPEQVPTGTGDSRTSDLQVEKYISIALVDRSSEKLIFNATIATILSQNWSVSARGIMTGSFTFQAFAAAPLEN